MPAKGLRERLRDGESIVCAEGYLWELERRGYLKSGPFTPEVVLDNPERVKSLHEEFVHAGSDVVEAFTYFGHRERLKTVGREDDLEQLNLTALKLARDVADTTHTLMAGNLSKSTIYDPDNPSLNDSIKEMFKEQVEWAVKGGADYIIAETFLDLGEAKLALEVIKEYGKGLPAVVTFGPFVPDVTADDVPIPEALRQLEELGADVVGLNCGRGPHTMLPLLREVRAVCKGPLAALPVPFRTTEREKSFQSLTDPLTGKDAYPLNMSPRLCSRDDIRDFAEEAKKLGVQYIGLCCGNSAVFMREIAQVYGKTPPSCKYAPDIRHSIAIGQGTMTPRQRKVQLHLMGRAYTNK